MTSTPRYGTLHGCDWTHIGFEGHLQRLTINIAAKKGVILAAGGYDQRLRRRHERGHCAFHKRRPGPARILMAMAAGADIRNMNNAWGCPHYNTPNGGVADWGLICGKPGVINLVNSAGERFTNGV